MNNLSPSSLRAEHVLLAAKIPHSFPRYLSQEIGDRSESCYYQKLN